MTITDSLTGMPIDGGDGNPLPRQHKSAKPEPSADAVAAACERLHYLAVWAEHEVGPPPTISVQDAAALRTLLAAVEAARQDRETVALLERLGVSVLGSLTLDWYPPSVVATALTDGKQGTGDTLLDALRALAAKLDGGGT